MFGLRTNEDEAMCLYHLGELGVLRKEAIAGVDRIGIRDFSRRQDARLLQIAFRRWRRANADAFIGQPYGHRVAISFGVHNNGGEAHFLAGPVNTERDLAAVCDEDFLDHLIGLTQ